MSFTKNVLTIGGANIGAQAINMALVPVVTRLYIPEEYGKFAFFLSLVMLFAPVSTLRLEPTILLPESREDAAHLFLLTLLASTLIALLVVPIVIFIISDAKLYHTTQPWIFQFLLPIGILLQGVLFAVNSWVLREKKFHPLAISTLLGTLSDRFLVITLGLFSFGSIGLISGRIIGPASRILTLYTGIIRGDFNKLRKSLSVARMKELLIEYKDFPLFSSWACLCNSASREMPTLILTYMFSPAVTGLYALGMRVMNLPMKTIGDALAKAFLQKSAANRLTPHLLTGDTKKLFGLLFDLLILPTVFLMTFGKELFALVFGSEWSKGGVYIQILMVTFSAMFLYRILSCFFDVFEKNKQRLFFDSSMLIARITALCLGARLGGSPEYALLGLTIATCVLYIIGYIYLFKLVGIGLSDIIRGMLRHSPMILPSVAGFPLIRTFFSGLTTQITACAVVVTIHFFLLYRSNPSLIHAMLDRLAKQKK